MTTDDATTEEAPPGTESGPTDTGSTTPPAGDVASAIADGIAQGTKKVFDALGLGSGEEVVSETEEEAPPARSSSSAAATEANVAAQVRAELDRIGAEEATEQRLAAVEDKVKETAPARLRRATKAMWGGGAE